MAERRRARRPRATAPPDDVDAIQEAWEVERPGTPVASIGVITRIWRVAKLLEDDRRRTMTRLGMDPGTRDLLSILRRSGAPYRLTAGELARRAKVTPGAMSQRLVRAESAGLVTRRRESGDARSVQVELTRKGHALLERTVDDLLRHEDGLLGSLDQGQRTTLADLLRVLLADLEGRAAEERGGSGS